MKRTCLFFVVLLSFVAGCRTLHLESEYKDPDTVLFHANKLLVVGMTPEDAVREAFETRLQEVFEEEGIESMRSIDLFDVALTDTPRTEEELDRVERQLLDKDFDAILFTKVIGRESRVPLTRKILEVGKSYDHFSEDYLLHQDVYLDRSQSDEIIDYYTETALYCICVGKDRSLIWRSKIHIPNPKNRERAIRQYISLIRERLQKNQVLLGTEVNW